MSDANDQVESLPLQIYNLKRELAQVLEQRDKLAEASSENTKDDTHKFCRTTYHCGCKYNS